MSLLRTNGGSTRKTPTWLPILGWLPQYKAADFRPDLLAGVTVAAMLVPQAMAYALLAGLPPEVGLYASTVPLVAYAVFGTSRQLAVGPVAIVSLMTASALGAHATEGTADYLTLAATLAILVGAVHLLMGVARLGFVVNLLSHSVLVGFTGAAAFIIGFSQIKHVLGIDVERHEFFYQTVVDVVDSLGDIHGATLLTGGAAFVALVAMRRSHRSIPGALVVVIATTAASALLNLSDRGVSVVGDIPAELPSLALPTFAGSVVADLATTAVMITFVGFMESIAVGKVYARRARYDIEPNQELIGLGAANLASGLFGGYPVTGGFSRTAVNAEAGARTPVAALITAAGVIVTLIAFTPLLRQLPQATLGAVVIVAIAGLVDIAEMRHIARVKRSDLITTATAFVATLAIGIELGIVVAVVVSLAVVFARISGPHSALLGRLPGTTTYRNIERFREAEEIPGIAILRIDASLSFANVAFLKRRFRDVESQSAEPLRAVIVDASGVNDIDASAEAMIVELLDEYRAKGIELVFTNLKGPVRDVLHRGGVWEQLGPSHLFVTNQQAVTALTAGDHRSDQHRPEAPQLPAGLDEPR